MRIGIVGAGFFGQAVARLASTYGHAVMLSNARGPESLAALAAGLGAQAGTVVAACEFGEVVLLALPLKQYRTVPVAPLAGKVVLDANNYYPERDGRIAALEERQTTTSQLLAAHLPEARLVKAFNAILAADLLKDGRPAGAPDRRCLAMAGEDPAAKRVAAALLEQFGFDVLDAGTLGESWRFERAKPAYCMPLDRAGLIAALAKAERDKELPDGSWRH